MKKLDKPIFIVVLEWIIYLTMTTLFLIVLIVGCIKKEWIPADVNVDIFFTVSTLYMGFNLALNLWIFDHNDGMLEIGYFFHKDKEEKLLRLKTKKQIEIENMINLLSCMLINTVGIVFYIFLKNELLTRNYIFYAALFSIAWFIVSFYKIIMLRITKCKLENKKDNENDGK